MTIIVAARVEGQGVVLASDSLTMAGWEKQYSDSTKLWVSDRYAFGGAGDCRAIQVVRHHVTWPKWRQDEDADWEAFLVKSAVPALRSGVKDHGVVKSDSGVESIEATFIAACGDRLAEISGNGCVVSPTFGRSAVGCGSHLALGYLGTSGPWTEDAVVDAARRAAAISVGCSGPISVVDTVGLQVRTLDA